MTNRCAKVNSSENIMNEYKHTLKRNKLYINTEKGDQNKKKFKSFLHKTKNKQFK